MPKGRSPFAGASSLADSPWAFHINPSPSPPLPLAQDREAVLERAAQAGVAAIIVTGTCVRTSRAAAALCDSPAGRRHNLHFTAGVHCHNAKVCGLGGGPWGCGAASRDLSAGAHSVLNARHTAAYTCYARLCDTRGRRVQPVRQGAVAPRLRAATSTRWTRCASWRRTSAAWPSARPAWTSTATSGAAATGSGLAHLFHFSRQSGVMLVTSTCCLQAQRGRMQHHQLPASALPGWARSRFQHAGCGWPAAAAWASVRS